MGVIFRSACTATAPDAKAGRRSTPRLLTAGPRFAFLCAHHIEKSKKFAFLEGRQFRSERLGQRLAPVGRRRFAHDRVEIDQILAGNADALEHHLAGRERLVASSPIFAPTPWSVEGSSFDPRLPATTTRSRSAWNRVCCPHPTRRLGRTRHGPIDLHRSTTTLCSFVFARTRIACTLPSFGIV